MEQIERYDERYVIPRPLVALLGVFVRRYEIVFEILRDEKQV
jgi:hypothetical protein